MCIRDSLITEDIDKLHIIEDKSKKVDTIELEEKINSGVLILQTSLGGEKWITDTILYDVFKDENSLKDAIYETNNYQLVNGCYYRIIVAYETSIRTEDKKIGPDKYDYKKNVEVYQFFIQDKSSQSESKTLEQTKNKNKRIGDLNKVKTDDGYALAHKELLEQGDPHFSKSIGDFYINGYTSEEFKDGDLVLLKKPGDKITLWFELTENIDCLFGNEKLSIAYDTDNNDTNFNYEGNEFKRGCLIIKQENKQGGKRIIPYTDFLSACSTATANTKVNLFEEGDYEVALNYEINKDEIIDKRTSYRISFKFKIRNANAMAYPRDIVSKSELSDNSFTPNGFWIDYANSQYINVYVKQYALKNSAGGRKMNVEVYQFFIQDKSSQSESKTLEQTKNKNKRIGDLNKVKTDDGYALAHKELLEQGDPHFSKSIGDFYINGYTSEEFKDGDLVLLKKPGDKITLWFELTENIDCLFGNEKLSIAYDTDNNDTNFNYEGNEFKRGCLIIKQENKQGGKRIIPYTDFLSACSTATANTKVNLFEEGDYEVALNYEINKDEIIDKRTSYRISFKFKIRNANAMAYPRDIVSKSELSDNSFTPNGFWIDYANSQYINVYVKQYALKNSAGGRKMDLRYDGSTNDEQKFSDPGIYTFIVKNEYTSLETTKTIYVGDDPFIKALAVTGLTIKELENELNNGAEILDNGTLQYPEPEVIEIVEEETNELDEESEDALNDNQAQEENSTKESEESKQVEVNDDTQKSSNVEKAVPAEDISSDEKAESDDLSVTENVKKSTNIMPWIIIGVLVVVIIFLAKKKNKDKD